MAAVRAGVGREQAHEAIKEHAVAVALAQREQGARRQRPASTGWPPIPGSASAPTRWPACSPTRSTSSAPPRTRWPPSSPPVEPVVAAHPEAASYHPAPIL